MYVFPKDASYRPVKCQDQFSRLEVIKRQSNCGYSVDLILTSLAERADLILVTAVDGSVDAEVLFPLEGLSALRTYVGTNFLVPQ